MNALPVVAASTRAHAPGTSPRLQGRVVERTAVDAALGERMFALLAGHFTGVERSTFGDDLSAKSAVILLEDEDRVLRGFSTLHVYRTCAPGRPVTIIYSGDTIVDRTCWGSHTLAKTWIQCVRQAAAAVATEVYWLLITSGYRTYRFLPVFFRAFYPRFDEPTPPDDQALLDAIARERFGWRYDSATGIVRLPRPQVLAGELLDVPSGRTSDAHVAFFLERNAGFVAGDELVCLTRIHDGNLTAAGRRMAGIARS
jgi:hypothetical protein